MRIFTGERARWLMAAGIGVLAVSSAQAQTTPQAAREIKGLLDFVEHSQCQFVRNGAEYPAPKHGSTWRKN